TVLGKRPGVDWRAVVGIQHVARAAPAAAIVAGMVVRPQEVERRIEQPRLLQADEYRIGPVLRSQPALAEAFARAARLFQPLGNADLGSEPPAALKNTQHVPRLRDFESRQGI